MRADLYYIPGHNKLDKMYFACRILTKAFDRQHQVYVHCDTMADANEIDKVLWTFQQNSFIPHCIVNTYKEDPPPIEIGYHECPQHHQDILLNLSDKPPHFFNRFNRSIEILVEDDKVDVYKSIYAKENANIVEHNLRK